MNSLRTRLFLGLTIVITVAGLAAGGLTYRWAFHEAIELQDSVLTQIGAVAVAGTHQRSALTDSKIEPEARVVLEELDNAEDASPEMRALNALPDGLHTVARLKEGWRYLLMTRTDSSRLAIGQPVAIRDEIARVSAFHILIPLAILVPFLMLVVGIVIGQTLKPMARLASELDRRTRELDPLPSQGMPSELRPFVASINRLLERIHAMVEQQRRFIADAAHELRTPITALSVQADNLTQADLPAEGRKRLAVLREGARRTAHLLDQLLALARSELNEVKNPPVTQVDQYAKEVMADLLPQARDRNIDLGFEVLNVVSVRAEPIMIATLVRNLLDNAIRHTPEGGRIDVALYREGDKAIFKVEDTGPGIPPDDLGRVFEPFFRGSRPVENGTGLGLSIVKRVVERLNGSIHLENISEPIRSGLRAEVTLPAYSGKTL
jgi:two-component system OmpR family sensor kinase